jgi:hypothetical protein
MFRWFKRSIEKPVIETKVKSPAGSAKGGSSGNALKGYVRIVDAAAPYITGVYAHLGATTGVDMTPPAAPMEIPDIKEFVRMSQFKAWVASQQAQRAYRDYIAMKEDADEKFADDDLPLRENSLGHDCEKIGQRAAYYSTLTDVEAIYVGFEDVKVPLYPFCIGIAQLLKLIKPAWFRVVDWTYRPPVSGDIWPPLGRKLDGEGFLIDPDTRRQRRYDSFEHVLVSPLPLDQGGVAE